MNRRIKNGLTLLFCTAVAVLHTGCPVLNDLDPLVTADFISVNGEPVAGTLRPGEVDYYRFLADGDTVYSLATFANTFLTLSVLDKDSRTLLTFADDYYFYKDDAKSQSKALLGFDPPEDGIYYIAVQGSFALHDTRHYTLSVNDCTSADDHGNSPLEATPIGVDGVEVPGVDDTIGICYDIDYFSVELTAGEVYVFETFGSLDTVLSLEDGLLVLGWSDDTPWSYNARLVFSPATSGTYYLAVWAYFPGPYTISARHLPQTQTESGDHGNTPGTASAITSIPGVVDATIGAFDEDWFSFSASSTNLYEIGTAGNLDTVVQIYSNGGSTLLTGDDDSGILGSSRVFFWPPSNDTYYVRLTGWNNSAGTTNLYIE